MIEARGLHHGYDGGREILRDLSFRIDEGERVVLLGPNGCGKSTLLKILNGLVTATAGVVTYEGIDLKPATLKNGEFLRRFRQEVVLLFQNPDAMLFNATVFDELAFGPRQLELPAVDERVERWARRAGLVDHLRRSPFGLSYGEKQKLCLASILILEPRLVLLDEPTSNLDPRTAGWLVEFLHELSITTLTTTHHLELAEELGSRVLVLGEDGRLLHDGGHPELMRNRDLLERANLVTPLRSPQPREITG